MHKKLVSVFLTLLTVGLLLASTSCGFITIQDVTLDTERETEEKVPPESVAENETEYEKYDGEPDGEALVQAYFAQLPQKDLGGALFTITAPSSDYIDPVDGKTSVSRMAIERNEQVESHFNVSITTRVDTSYNIREKMKAAKEAGSYYSDLVMVPIYTVGQFQKEELLADLNTLPYFDQSQPYFYKESAEMSSGGYATYAIAGEASVSPDSFSAVFMNKTLLGEAGIDAPSLYKMAEKGTWTWDEMIATMEALSAGNGTDEAQKGPYTLVTENGADRLADLVFKASGHDFVMVRKMRAPVIGFYVHGVQDTLDRIAFLLNDPGVLASQGVLPYFEKGEAAFLIDQLHVLPQLANATVDWGLLPLPAGEEGGEYRTLVANMETVFAVPAIGTDGERASLVLSALNAAYGGYIHGAYVDYAMYHYLRDNASVNMLDRILDTPAFDFAFAYGNAYPEIGDATYKLLRSTAKANDMAKYYTDLKIAANRLMSEEFAPKS